MTIKSPITHEQYESMSHAEKLEVAEKYWSKLFTIILEWDDHSAENLDVDFIYENEDVIRNFTDKQKLEVAIAADAVNAVKMSYHLADDISKHLGISEDEFKALDDDTASDELRIKLVDWVIQNDITSHDFNQDMVEVMCDDKTIDEKYKLHILDFVFDTWDEEQLLDAWEMVLSED